MAVLTEAFRPDLSVGHDTAIYQFADAIQYNVVGSGLIQVVVRICNIAAQTEFSNQVFTFRESIQLCCSCSYPSSRRFQNRP